MDASQKYQLSPVRRCKHANITFITSTTGVVYKVGNTEIFFLKNILELDFEHGTVGLKSNEQSTVLGHTNLLISMGMEIGLGKLVQNRDKDVII